MAYTLNEYFTQMRSAARGDPYPSHDGRDRRLAALEQIIRDHTEDFSASIASDFGHRSAHETRLLEILPSLEAIRFARRHLKHWMEPEPRRTSRWFLTGSASVHHEPLGVVGIIVPWNYPLYLAFAPLVAALAAGNRVMLKLSELPVAVIGAPDDCAIMREEIFGPLLPLVSYDSLEGAISYVATRPRPLALYYFDHDRSRIERVLSETKAGGVTINDVLFHIAQEDLPFGGIGASGMGRYHGHDGFVTFSNAKAVFHQSRLAPATLLRPPYEGRVDRLIRFLSSARDWRMTE